MVVEMHFCFACKASPWRVPKGFFIALRRESGCCRRISPKIDHIVFMAPKDNLLSWDQR